LADAGQALELIDEPSDRFGKVRHQRSPGLPARAVRGCAGVQEPAGRPQINKEFAFT
jgi:hypothetical protein